MNYYLRSVTEVIYVNHFQEWPIKSPMHAFPPFSLPSYQINVKNIKALLQSKRKHNTVRSPSESFFKTSCHSEVPVLYFTKSFVLTMEIGDFLD